MKGNVLSKCCIKVLQAVRSACMNKLRIEGSMLRYNALPKGIPQFTKKKQAKTFIDLNVLPFVNLEVSKRSGNGKW